MLPGRSGFRSRPPQTALFWRAPARNRRALEARRRVVLGCRDPAHRPAASARDARTHTADQEGMTMSASRGEAFVLGPGEGRSIDLGGFRMSVKASGGETGGAFSLLQADEPPGFGPPIHIHHDAAEAFYVLGGEYIMYLEDREFVCPAGSFIYVPQGVRHGFKVGDVPSRKLNFYFPASMIGYFDDLASALQRESVSDEELGQIAIAHSMEIVGPPSERYV